MLPNFAMHLSDLSTSLTISWKLTVAKTKRPCMNLPCMNLSQKLQAEKELPLLLLYFIFSMYADRFEIHSTHLTGGLFTLNNMLAFKRNLKREIILEALLFLFPLFVCRFLRQLVKRHYYSRLWCSLALFGGTRETTQVSLLKVMPGGK